MAPLTFSQFIKGQFSKPASVVKTDLSGKTVVLIGANTGLGFEACKHFASMNPERLIMGCRNKAKGEAAVAKIKAETGYSKAELWTIDLSNFASVKAFVDKFEKEGGRLDILIENAGVMGSDEYEVTEDGWASIFQVNDIAPSLHALLLLPYMLRTAAEHNTTPRLVMVASEVHYWSNLVRDDKVVKSKSMLKEMSSKEFHQRTSSTQRYFDSKLLNVYFARALQKRLPNTITVNSLNPGFCISEFDRNQEGAMALLGRLMKKVLAFTTEEGSRQLVYAAIAQTENEEQMRGAFVSGSKVVEPSDDVVSEFGAEMQERFWSEILDVCKNVDPRIQQVVEKCLQ
ncbi:retinol dehydrogenase 12 [Moniliophthora roreri MCA 2997]|uniref:Retinol dehydrogenase 12 n=1 Tax=Moniliophthora roreri (strain MCA 2997) TaxID=1381753 RepID=V2YKX9_MONRO|nr:retinol dehydrogenase 12 [Moniliophthora roreri MCA 2997]